MRFRSTESEPGQHLALEVVLSPVGRRRIAEGPPQPRPAEGAREPSLEIELPEATLLRM